MVASRDGHFGFGATENTAVAVSFGLMLLVNP